MILSSRKQGIDGQWRQASEELSFANFVTSLSARALAVANLNLNNILEDNLTYRWSCPPERQLAESVKFKCAREFIAAVGTAIQLCRYLAKNPT